MEQSIAVKMIVLVAAASHAAAGLRPTPWWVASQRRACAAPAEVVCSTDCTELLVCIGDGSGGYTPELVAVCPSDTRCSAEQAACVVPGSSECHPPLPADQFTCKAVGIFPDPYDCQKYHICTGPGAESVTGTCEDTMAYNPLKADCSLTTSDRVCTEGPIPACTRPGDLGVVPENPAIYYICKQKGTELIPELSRCPGSKIYDPTAASCVQPPTTSEPTQPACPSVTPTPSNTPSNTPTETPEPSETPSTPTQSSPPAGKCSTPKETVPDPADCHRYYQCIGDTWQHITCIYGYHYDVQQKICVYGACPTR